VRPEGYEWQVISPRVAETTGSGWVDYMFPKPKGRPNRLGNGLREEGDCGRSSWLGKRRAGLEEYVASSIVRMLAEDLVWRTLSKWNVDFWARNGPPAIPVCGPLV
jgi:hypothetical protein